MFAFEAQCRWQECITNLLFQEIYITMHPIGSIVDDVDVDG